jgi:hypothetical protein
VARFQPSSLRDSLSAWELTSVERNTARMHMIATRLDKERREREEEKILIVHDVDGVVVDEISK